MLRLISWNIQCARTPSGAPDLNQVAAALAQCCADGAADIVLLQEIGCRVAARDGSILGDQFAGLAARLPGYRGIHALALELPDADGAPRGIGCMTFARHPVLQVRRHALPWPPDAEVQADGRSMPRTVLDTTIATPAGPLRVLNAHLEYFSLRQRLAQIDYLRALGEESAERAAGSAAGHATDDGAGDVTNHAAGAGTAADRPNGTAHTILAGDFNLLPGSESYRRMFAPGAGGAAPWQDAWMLAHPHTPHAPTVGLHELSPGAAPFTFDYFCVGPALAPRVRSMRVAPAAGGSDHQPVLLELD